MASTLPSPSIPRTRTNTGHFDSAPKSLGQFILLLLVGLSSLNLFLNIIPAAEAALAVRASNASTVNYRSWDPFQGLSPSYTLSGILVMGQVQVDCTVLVVNATNAARTGQAILTAIDPLHPIEDTILVLRYDWLDNCATFDDVSTFPISSPVAPPISFSTLSPI